MALMCRHYGGAGLRTALLPAQHLLGGLAMVGLNGHSGRGQPSWFSPNCSQRHVGVCTLRVLQPFLLLFLFPRVG